MCFMMGGDLELLCKEACPAYQEVASMYHQFKLYLLESELTLQEFFDLKVRVEGAKIYQAA
jgi:hypothetical protein